MYKIDLSKLSDKEIHEFLYRKALWLLSTQARTSEEIKKRLLKYFTDSKLPESEHISQIVQRLEDEKLINDRKYVEDFAFSLKNSSKPKSYASAKRYLRTKNLSTEHMDHFESNISTEDLLEMAVKQLKNKARLFTKMEGYKKRQKAINYLINRGFSYDTAVSAFDSVFAVD